MIQGHVFLVLLLLLIGATVLWTFISTANTRWYVKASLTTLMLFAILSAWVGLQSIYGYPYKSWPNNENYILVGSHVQEPKIKQPDSGAIYLWLIDSGQSTVKRSWIDVIAGTINGRQPRGYVIQYDRQLHEQLAKMEKMREGEPMPIRLIKKAKIGDSEETHNGERSDDGEFQPYIFPDIVTIEKTTR